MNGAAVRGRRYKRRRDHARRSAAGFEAQPVAGGPEGGDAQGLFYNVAETGAGTDAPHLRPPARTWVVVVEPDGSLVVSAAPVQRRER